MTEDNKCRIGKFIGIYRNYYDSKTRSNKWGKEKFVHYCSKTICSIETLDDIEEGKICSDDEVYEMLLNKLDMKFVQCEELDQLLTQYIYEFYDAVKYFDRQRADVVIEKIKLHQESEFAFYRQIVECMEFVVNFEFDNIVNKDLFYFLNLAKSIDSVPLGFLVAFSLLSMNLDTELNEIMIIKSIEFMSENNLGDELYLEAKYLSYQLNQYFCESYGIKNDCSKIYRETCNKKRLFSIRLLMLCNETLFGRLNSFEAKILKLQEEEMDLELPKRQYIITNLNFSIIYFMNNDFKKTIECINKVIAADLRAVCKVSPYYFSALENLRLPIKEMGVERILLEKCENHYYVFYRYYILKHVEKISCNELLKYLLKRVVPAIKAGIYGTQTIDIFEKEVVHLAELTRNYKSILDFRTKLIYSYSNIYKTYN